MIKWCKNPRVFDAKARGKWHAKVVRENLVKEVTFKCHLAFVGKDFPSTSWGTIQARTLKSSHELRKHRVWGWKRASLLTKCYVREKNQPAFCHYKLLLNILKWEMEATESEYIYFVTTQVFLWCTRVALVELLEKTVLW